jgi:protein tyrosine phosphatase (PTP) superfamily phosphohydrolase (DUF442 family)
VNARGLGAPAAALAAAAILVACGGEPPREAAASRDAAAPAIRADRAERAPVAPPAVGDPAPRDYPGIHNAVAYHDGFVSGGVPEGEAGFDTLRAMGVRTVISVDGAEPDAARARARGMRYVHLPIGYDGFDAARRMQLVRAVRDAMRDGPVYLHCHHGKHRSAGAAATVAVALGWLSPDASVARMRVSGTAPGYRGLYACAARSVPESQAAIDAVPADFPEVTPPAGFVRAMVEADLALDHLKAIERAGWAAPADHPDLVPAAEAGRLADLLRLHVDGDRARAKPSGFGAMLAANAADAQRLEDMLVADPRDAAMLGPQLARIAAGCRDCHVKWRD